MKALLLTQRALAGAGVGAVLLALPLLAAAAAQSPSVTSSANGTATYDNSGTTGFGNTGTTGFGNTGTTGFGNSGTTGTGGATSVQNPLGATSLCGLLKKLFQGVVAIAIPIAVIFIVWSGFKFVLAQGNSKELQKARNNFMWTVIGIAVFLGAWLIATVIASTINAIGGSAIISCQ